MVFPGPIETDAGNVNALGSFEAQQDRLACSAGRAVQGNRCGSGFAGRHRGCRWLNGRKLRCLNRNRAGTSAPSLSVEVIDTTVSASSQGRVRKPQLGARTLASLTSAGGSTMLGKLEELVTPTEAPGVLLQHKICRNRGASNDGSGRRPCLNGSHKSIWPSPLSNSCRR